MGTHAAIVEKVEDGYKGIYLHYDGYPSYAGKILTKHYTDPAKVSALINLGALSTIAREVNPTQEHSWQNPQDEVCVAYHRDRGEPICIKTGLTLDAVVSQIDCEYVYVFEDGKWRHSECD
jgi:hypothetical protein